MAAATLRLLGRPQVEHAGTVTPLPVERRCQLLALLALRRGWVARTELAALFWPDQRPALAATNLRKALHFARALPWAAALETQGAMVRFAVATDVHDVEQAQRDGRLGEALELCRGELLDGMDDVSNGAWTDWLDAERAQQQRRWQALTRARLAQLADRPAERAAFARRLLDADALDEDAVVALLAAQREQRAFDEQREAYRAFALRLDEELGVEPSQRVRALMLAPMPSGAARSVAAPRDGLYGREQELAELAALLARDECRLLTVIGPGGIGKSSLAKGALRRLASRFSDGTHWIALDDLHDSAQVAARIAAELQLAPSPQQQPLALVCEHLASRNVLLVLDNAEHLAGLTLLVERLLAQAPRLRLCATSRVRLGAQGEWLLPLPGLAVPSPHERPEDALASPAVQLFAAAAHAVRPDFDTAGQLQAIGTLVRATGGLPLAILLAANWVRLLPAAEIAAELARSLDVLESADEGEERPEHRSVRATFEQSWQRLTAREQRALSVLSVFAGTFSRDAAHDVAGAALPVLAALADKSLLQIAGTRCSLHPLIRQFAHERLGDSALAAAQRRHAAYFHRLLARLAPAAQAAEQAALDEIGSELEDCRQAWRWAIAQRASEQIAGSAAALKEYFNVRGRVAEGLELLGEARTVVGENAPAAGAALMSALAQTHYRLSQLDEAAASARQGIRYARLAGSRVALVRCLSVLGTCCGQWGRNGEAQRLLQQAARLARANGDARGAALAIHNLALVENSLGNHARAAELMREWLLAQREQGEWLRLAMGLSNLAYFHQAQGEWALAQQCLEEGLALCDAHDLSLPRPPLLANLSHNHAMSGRLDDAERASRQLLDEVRGKRLSDVEATALNQLVRIAILRGDLAEARQRLRDALPRALATNIEYVQLDCVLSHARILAGERRADEAGPLLRYLLARPNLEPVDRADAEACLRKLAQTDAPPVPAETPLDVLLKRLAG